MKIKKKDVSKSILNKFSPASSAAFIACFVSGLIIHIFAFTNIIPNSDGISRIADAQQMTVSGRWFLHYASAFNGYLQMPAVIGFFSVLFMSASAFIVADILKIKSRTISAFCGILMIVFPATAYTYLYMFTASAYFFGIFLAVISVWLCQRYKYGFIFSAPLLACAIATYQAYLAVAASLLVISVILYALSDKNSLKKSICYGCKCLGMLVLSLILYLIVLKIFLAVKNLELLSYKGAENIFSIRSPMALLHMIAHAYKEFIGYFFIGGSFCTYGGVFLRTANVISALCALIALVNIIVKKKIYKDKGKLLIILILCLLLPLALSLFSLMGESTPVMQYSLVFTYIFVLALVHRSCDNKEGRAPLKYIALIASGMVIFSSFLTDNLAYTVSAQAHRASETFAANLVSRVESLEGYQSDMEVVIIGAFPSDIYYTEIERYAEVENYSCLSSSVMPLNKHIYYYLNDWLNVRWQEPSEETKKAVSESDIFKEMPLYPSDNSVTIDNGRVIVKLSDEYIPKADFEIAYENRR